MHPPVKTRVPLEGFSETQARVVALAEARATLVSPACTPANEHI
jgi:hypothetical protein